MSHSIIIIGRKLEDLGGNATEGMIPLLRTNAITLDTQILEYMSEPPLEWHEVLENLQECLVDGGTLDSGIGDVLTDYNTEIESYLG